MGKKKEKAKKEKASSNPADVLRDAVERTFAGAAGGVAGAGAGAQQRAQELFDDATQALNRLRNAVDERRVLETLDQLRDQVEGLAKRVAALEREGASGSGSTPEAPKTAAGTRARSTAAKSGSGTATKRSTSSRSASGTTRSRSTTARSTRASSSGGSAGAKGTTSGSTGGSSGASGTTSGDSGSTSGS